jgi:NNP family nitrate/nitrite transporter-like MFS transporter
MSGERPEYRWFLLFHVALVQLIGGGISWNYLFMVSTEIMAELDIGITGWSQLWAGISFGVLLFAIPAGSLGDRFGVRRVIGCGLVLNCATLLFRAGADSFPMLLVSMFPFGMSLAVLATNLPKALGMWFPPERLGLANGVALAGFGLGQGIAAFATPRLLPYLGTWRELTLWLAGLIFLLTFYWFMLVRDAPAHGTAGPGLLRSIKEVLRVRDVWLVAICHMFYFGAHLGVIGYLPAYFGSVQRISPSRVGLVLSIAAWVGIAGSVVLPALSDRFGRRKIVYVVTTLLTGGVVFSMAHLLGIPLMIASAVWGLSAGAVGLVFVVPVEMERVGPALAGSAIGVIISAGFLGGVLAPVLGMSLADSRPLLGFAFFTLCYLVAAVLFCIVRETGKRG